MAAGASLSLFAGRRLVLVRGVGDLGAKVADRLREALAEARRDPGGWPAEGTTRAAGVDLAPDAAQALVDLVGEDLSRLAAEVEKASLYAAGDRRVSQEVVRALAGETRTRQYWELTQALEEARRTDAIRVASQLLASGDEPLILLAWITGYLRDLWRVLPGAVAGDLREAARSLQRRRPDFAVERLTARARAVGIRGLSRAVRQCFEVDQALKTGGGNPRALLTCLVAELAG